MLRNRRICHTVAFFFAISGAAIHAGSISAQTAPTRSIEKSPPLKVNPASISESGVAESREELFRLLRVSPRLTTVVARDPSLLADQEYVARNNPELAQFLQDHPEVARNPEYYLFGSFGTSGKQARELNLERAIWPDLRPQDYSRVPREVVPFLVFVCVLGSLLWLFRVLLENRRWGRIFKMQTEVHSRLLDKFSANEELITYMQSEAGKRFLEAAPIPTVIGQGPQMSSHVARILGPLQLGVVLAMVGSGLLYLRNSISEMGQGLLVFGTLALMLGIGFILAAAVSWGLASHFGLLPQNVPAKAGLRPMQETKGQP